ncbi:MAG: glycerophosphodiester phosphodiesterase family protein [Lachnospiraceae bacterium]|nr:glycerophosphodiester phosphodiesterase family protein [Lachnospiraceae bacterium]
MRQAKDSVLPYRHAFLPVLLYQLISKGILLFLLLGYRYLKGVFMWKIGRPSFTRRDLPYLVCSWQGWLILLSGTIMLVIYTAFDLTASMLLSEKLYSGQRVRGPALLKETAHSLKDFIKKGRGNSLFALLYAALILPFICAFFGITYVPNLVIPNYVISTIQRRASYRLGYGILILILVLAGVVNIFTLHSAMLGKKPASDAMDSSRRLMQSSWKRFLAQTLAYLGKWLLLLAGIIFLLYFLPMELLPRLPIGKMIRRGGVIFFSILTLILLLIGIMAALFFMQMKMTVLYHAFTDGRQGQRKMPRARRRPYVTLIACVLVGTLAMSAVGATHFDSLFPLVGASQIVAHRAGGNMANENTVLALNTSIAMGAYGAEVDVHRTRDGKYIINHDKTFKRLCGVDKKPSEMTLKEIKQLRVKDLAHPFAGTTEIATMEEMLNAARGKIRLFVELKAPDADKKMADAVAKMIEKRDMLDDVMIISLNYDIIYALKTKHPEVRTGYLTYFAFRNLDKMPCDAILMEEEVATPRTIKKVHDAGKEVGIWTVNTSASIADFMASEANWVITDEVPRATYVQRLLEDPSDQARVFIALIRWF